MIDRKEIKSRLKNDAMPQLYKDSDVEEMVDNFYHNCYDKNCEECKYRNSVEYGACLSDLLMEVWRRYKNAENCYKNVLKGEQL